MDIKTKYKSLVEEFSDCCPNKEKYCTLREFILQLAKDPRLLVQIKCIEKYKWSLSKEVGKDIGWNGAGEAWVEKGLAKRFSELYNEDKSINQLYKEIIGES